MNITRMNITRKLIIITTFITLLLGMTIFTGCQAEVEEEESNKVEIVNIGKLGEDLDIVITMPSDLNDPKYFILNEKYGEITFEEEDVKYICLVEGSVEAKNLYEEVNGVKDAFVVEESGLEGETTYTLMVNSNFVNVVNWYHDEVAYTLYTEGQGLDEKAVEMARKIIKSQG